MAEPLRIPEECTHFRVQAAAPDAQKQSGYRWEALERPAPEGGETERLWPRAVLDDDPRFVRHNWGPELIAEHEGLYRFTWLRSEGASFRNLGTSGKKRLMEKLEGKPKKRRRAVEDPRAGGPPTETPQGVDDFTRAMGHLAALTRMTSEQSSAQIERERAFMTTILQVTQGGRAQGDQVAAAVAELANTMRIHMARTDGQIRELRAEVQAVAEAEPEDEPDDDDEEVPPEDPGELPNWLLNKGIKWATQNLDAETLKLWWSKLEEVTKRPPPVIGPTQ